jgi:hypothetical protein
MPVMSCTENDKPGYKYGEGGRCYTYSPDDEDSRKEAKRKAIIQGAAIASQTGEKLNIEKADYEDLIEDDDSYEEANNLEFEINDNFKTDDNNFQEVLEDTLKFPNSEIEKNIPSSSDLSSDLKKISINLGEVHEENIDYKNNYDNWNQGN